MKTPSKVAIVACLAPARLIASYPAARRLLDSGAFQPQYQQRTKQDAQNLREAKQQSGGEGTGMGTGMGGMR